MALSVQITIDCAHPDRLATFWAEALRYRKQDPPDGYATWPEALAAHGVPEDKWDSASAVVDPEGSGPRIFFQRVPEPKAGKNRVHLDLSVGGEEDPESEEHRARVEAELERLVAAGATRVPGQGWKERHGGLWVVMQDPEGNEFCVQ